MRRTAILLLLVASTLSADVKKHTFAGREWSIDVPPTYVHEQVAPRDPITSLITYMPNRRLDGTFPMIDVLLTAEVPKEGAREWMTKFGDDMINTVRRRREQWQVERTEVKVGRLTMVRYAWSGVAIPAKNGAQGRIPMRGVMLVGIDGRIAIMMHAQDSTTFANETLPASEAAMRTFRIAP